jgi:large subunit ribosomal protein L6
MSRIGKKLITIPHGVTVAVSGSTVSAKGPKGELSHTLPRDFSADVSEGTLRVIPPDRARSRSLWGTQRALLANMIRGVHEGYEKRLEIQGVGFRAQGQGRTLTLNVGFSHPVEYAAPEGIEFSVEKNIITVSGIDKTLVGEVAASVRQIKKPEPYKGKGIRYVDEVVRRKAGKKAATAAA